MAKRELGGYDIPSSDVTEEPGRVDPGILRELVARVLEAVRYPASRARLVADSLVDADMRGISSHGVTRARIYTKRALAGVVDPSAEPQLVRDHRAARLLDARNAPGHIAADVAVAEAIKGAEAFGVCGVGVKNSNHCGTLAYFLRRIAQSGYVALAASNGPAVMAYHGGRSRAVGTNPLGYAIPRSDGPPIILDMATSNAARGKIIQLARSGQGQVPEGWAVDLEGRPTTDPVEALAGAVLPFGGPKGSGLAMGVDLLCGTLLSGVTGTGIGDMYEDWDRLQHVGHVFFALDPACWVGREAFDENVRHFVEEIRSLSPAVGHSQVYLPGELEDLAADDAARDGIPLSGDVIADLLRLAQELHVNASLAVRRSADPSPCPAEPGMEAET
ncbi:Ldh family oxidoreductase [Pseudonocardia sichuanensis]